MLKQNYRLFLTSLPVSILFIYLLWNYNAKRDVWHPQTRPKKTNRNVFFLETSGKPFLTLRETCAIESSVKWNPKFKVHVIMNLTNDFNSSSLFNSLLDMKVKFRNLNFEDEFAGTALEEWYRGRSFENSSYRIHHLSDALRLAVLWRKGGLYLDSDVVVLRSFDYLKNALIYEDSDSIANGIMQFDKHHQLLDLCIKDFAANYNSKGWGDNGPLLIYRNFKKYCPNYQTTTEDCGIQTWTKDVAYKISYHEWKSFFDPEKWAEVLKSLENSTFAHVWNKFSSVEVGIFGEGSAYEMLMAEHCPVVYSEVKRIKTF